MTEPSKQEREDARAALLGRALRQGACCYNPSDEAIDAQIRERRLQRAGELLDQGKDADGNDNPHKPGCQYVVNDRSFTFCPKCGASLAPDLIFLRRVPIYTLIETKGVEGEGTLEILYSPQVEEGTITLFMEPVINIIIKWDKAAHEALIQWAKDQ